MLACRPRIFLILLATLLMVGIHIESASAQITIANKGTANATLLYRGKPMLKVGPLPEVAPFAVEWGSKVFPHEQWLDWMQTYRLGYGRVYPESGYPWLPYDADRRVLPFQVVKWEGERPIVDLTKFNPAYWQNFARVIKECADRGIVLQIQLYQRVFFRKGDEQIGWQTNYFNPRNNVNNFPVSAEPNGYGLWARMTKDPQWQAIHRQWVEHILQAVGDHGNVIIDLMNEGSFRTGLTKEWIEYTLDLIEQWERKTGHDILVGMDFDHLYKTNDKGLEHVLSHPRLEVLIGEGSEGHVVRDLVAGDRTPMTQEDVLLKFRERYQKPAISTNSPAYSVHEDPGVLRLYQWYAMMLKVQGAGVYAKTYPIEFSSPPVEQYARESQSLMGFFDTLGDYVQLQPSSAVIVGGPGRYRLALGSRKEIVVYLHMGEQDAAVKRDNRLSLRNLQLDDGKVSVTFMHPGTGKSNQQDAAVRDGELTLTLPEFREDLAIHVLRK